MGWESVHLASCLSQGMMGFTFSGEGSSSGAWGFVVLNVLYHELGEGTISEFKNEGLGGRVNRGSDNCRIDVVGLVSDTVALVENGDGRWRMLSKSACDVKVKEGEIEFDNVSIGEGPFGRGGGRR